jgi:Protein of unknown function (Hypoth_ymh)
VAINGRPRSCGRLSRLLAQLVDLQTRDVVRRQSVSKRGETVESVADQLVTLDPVMRDLMNAARPGFGDYLTLDDAESIHCNVDYWDLTAKPWALRAIGVHTLGAEARERMRPDSPELAADQLTNGCGDPAPLWETGNRQAAIYAAARSVNAHLQHKLDRRNASDTALCREVFYLKASEPGRPRLRFPGVRTSDTWRSRQLGCHGLRRGGASTGSAIRPRMRTGSFFRTRSRWRSSLPSACRPAGLTSAPWRPSRHRLPA